MAISKTAYFDLNKPSLATRNWHIPLNDNFDIIDLNLKKLFDKDVELDQKIVAGDKLLADNMEKQRVELATRLDNIIKDGGESNVEIVDARLSETKGKTFTVLKDRLEETEKDKVQLEQRIFDPNGQVKSSILQNVPLQVVHDRITDLELLSFMEV